MATDETGLIAMRIQPPPKLLNVPPELAERFVYAQECMRIGNRTVSVYLAQTPEYTVALLESDSRAYVGTAPGELTVSAQKNFFRETLRNGRVAKGRLAITLNDLLYDGLQKCSPGNPPR